MRVLFVGAHFPRPNNPTIGTWALSQLIALQKHGHELRVISPIPAIPAFVTKILRRGTSSACPRYHSWNGIPTDYIRWPVFPVGGLGRLLRARPDLAVALAWKISSEKFFRIAEEFSPDVVFAHHGYLGGFVAANLARELNVPFFVAEHSFGEIESCVTNSHRRRHYMRMLRGISGWIAVSGRLHDSMKRVFPQAPVITIHNGADTIPARIRSVPRPEKLANADVVLSVSFFYKRKNIPLLIEAFDEIAGKHAAAMLVIIGDGDDRGGVLEAMEKAIHRSRIVLLGALAHADVLQYMVWCDVFALIGRNEPFGVVFTEAMMAGRPIIYANDGGIVDIAISGVHGVSVIPDDKTSASTALDELLVNRGAREQMGRAAAALAESRLSWATNAAQLTDTFTTSIDSGLDQAELG